MALGEKSKEPPKSLLQTASNAKLGASKKALNVIQSNVNAPVKKINLIPKSDESKVSALTGSIAFMKAPMVLEVGELEQGHSKKNKEIKKITNFAGPKFRSGKIRFGLETARRHTPQPPRTTTQRLMKVANNGWRGGKLDSGAQKGIVISAPSPMSLDRIHVQLGQEKVLPESKAVVARKELEKRERDRLAREVEYQSVIDNVKKQLQSNAIKEQEEGFEVIDTESEVLRAMMQTVQPAQGNPSHMAEARFLARKALASRPLLLSTRSNGNKKLAKNQFPVSEIREQNAGDTISAMENPRMKTNANALIDELESEYGTFETTIDGTFETAIDPTMDCTMGQMLVGTLLGGGGLFAEEAVNGPNSPRGGPNSPRVANIIVLDDDGVVDLTKGDDAPRLRTRSTPNGEKPTSPRSMGEIANGEEDGAAADSNNNMREIPDCPGLIPSAGVMCGAVPLYFMYKSQKQEEEESIQAQRMRAVLRSKNHNLDELQQKVIEAADIAMKDSEQVGEVKVKNINRQILGKDDAYWDTLSTIASTKGLDVVEELLPPTTKASPGPIPIEITTNKEDTEEEKKVKKNETKVTSSKTPKDAKPDEVDDLPTPKASSKPVDPDPVELSNDENMNTLNELSRNNKVVSWGPEKNYQANAARSPRRFTYDGEPPIEDDEPPLDYVEEQDLLTRTLQLSKDLLASLGQQFMEQPQDLEEHEYQEQPQQVVERSNLSVETDADVDTYNGKLSYSSNEDFPIDVEKLIAEHGMRQACEDEEVIPVPDEDEYYHQEPNVHHHTVYHQDLYQQGPGARHHNRYEQEMSMPEMDEFRSPRTPQIMSKLDVLRSQRNQALARFQDSRRHADGLPPSSNPELQDNQYAKSSSMADSEFQQQEPLKFFQPSMASSPSVGQYDHQVTRVEEHEVGSEASATPSKKAQNLRRQMDEALVASREIRKSQDKLGDDLLTFKSRLYQRNGELEGQAQRAMRMSGAGIRHADV